MKIAIVETDARGGLIHFAYEMAEALSAEGVQPVLLTGQDYELEGLPHGFEVIRLLHFWRRFEPAPASAGAARRRALIRPFRRAWRGLVFMREWARLTAYLLRTRPDATVFSLIHVPLPVIYLRILRAAGLPIFQVCHEIEQRDADAGLVDRAVMQPLFRTLYRSFDGIVFLARSVQRDFEARFGDIVPTHVLPIPVQLLFHPGENDRADTEAVRERYGIADGERVVLFFGLLRPSKGVPDLVEAFARLPDRAGLRLVIAGHPNKAFDAEEIKALADRLGISGNVTLHLEYVPNEDVAPLLSQADVVVFPYRNATASAAAATAQGLCRPVIATDVGGLGETIEDGVTGRLVPPQDPEALSRAIAETLSDPAAATGMAERAFRELSRTRSWPVFAARLLRILRRDGTG